jgi:hypothetical protein
MSLHAYTRLHTACQNRSAPVVKLQISNCKLKINTIIPLKWFHNYELTIVNCSLKIILHANGRICCIGT